MKVLIVIASINELTNIQAFKPALKKGDLDLKVIVVDEGNYGIRKRNERILSEVPHAFYGPKEREDWFKQRFGSAYEKYLSVIPERCHAETSFGFLAAYEEMPDLVLELDDDVFPFQKQDILGEHANNLFKSEGIEVDAVGRWYNTIENLMLNKGSSVFPRGHPYSTRTRKEKYIWQNNGSPCVLNMGLWAGHLDLDALSILYHGGLEGRCNIKGTELKRKKIIVGKNTYLAICSMNTSFTPKIIPAFYQLYMNYRGLDRFDDIWSGTFLKKVADHLEDKICLGAPLVKHEKRPRDVLEDLRKELEGIAINEKLWTIVDSICLNGSSYTDAYLSLIDGLEKNINQNFSMDSHKKISMQIKKMRTWLELFERL